MLRGSAGRHQGFADEFASAQEEVWERERRMLIFSLVDRNQASGDLRCQEAPALALFDADVERLAQRAVGQSDPPFLPERFFSTAGPAACNEGATGIESPDVALIHRLNVTDPPKILQIKPEHINITDLPCVP